MNNIPSGLRKCRFFKDIEDDVDKVTSCLGAKVVSYGKEGLVMQEGDAVESIGIVLSGKVMVIKEDLNGNASIINKLGEGEVFGESMICAGIKNSDVTVRAAERTRVMFLDYGKIITLCPNCCAYHLALVRNLVELIANKNVLLNQKMEIITRKTIREKLLGYFILQSKTAGSRKFRIPFNRTELAFFIGADRSAMTRELAHMREDGLIRFDKKDFELM